MEEEAREILKAGLASTATGSLNLADSIRRRIAPKGGVELSLPVRDLIRSPPKLHR